ncbi:hypothetical protein [Oryza sativa Japonica Group]|uniref:Uncharacterized protein n=2 Tax=Oryza sativa subsp. japonica TaxID=39947 RepID=A2ZYD8_ORYSJ|nr:hypothetical protein OsJ_03657 [Oryza sativa Japonica Group]BAD53240.1 hypothetical protein [Oryza sativa Japonica Group]
MAAGRCSRGEARHVKGWGEDQGLNSDYGSYRAPDVKDEKNPAAGPGRMSLSLPTCPSEIMDPHLEVFSPNLLPT